MVLKSQKWYYARTLILPLKFDFDLIGPTQLRWLFAPAISDLKHPYAKVSTRCIALEILINQPYSKLLLVSLKVFRLLSYRRLKSQLNFLLKLFSIAHSALHANSSPSKPGRAGLTFQFSWLKANFGLKAHYLIVGEIYCYYKPSSK